MTAANGSPQTTPATTPAPSTTPRLRAPANLVSSRAVALWTIELVLAGLVEVAVAWGMAAWAQASRWSFVPDRLLDLAWWLPVLTAAVAVLHAAVAPTWRYRVHRWEVGSDVVFTRTGSLSREWLLVPVSRIQTVDTAQGVLERLLRLATIKINTASHAGSSQVAGLPVEVATKLAQDLARRAHELRDDAT